MMETRSAYWQFLKKPQLLKLAPNKTMLWKDISWLLILDFAFAGLVISIYELLLNFNLINKYEEFDIFKYGFAIAMLFGAIVAPILEESIFRWQLTKPKVSVWFVMVSLALLICSFTNSEYAKFFIFIFFFAAGLAVFFVVEKLGRVKKVKLFRGYYVFLFYYTAVIFGYIHITNIQGLTIADPSFIIYVISQGVSGLSMGYLRIKYGLGYSVLFHGFFNAVFIPIAWVLN